MQWVAARLDTQSFEYKRELRVSLGLQLFHQPPEAHAGCSAGSALVVMAGEFCITGLEYWNHKSFGIAHTRNQISGGVVSRLAIAR